MRPASSVLGAVLVGALLAACAPPVAPAEVVLVAPPRPPPKTIYGHDPPAPPRDAPPPPRTCGVDAPPVLGLLSSDARACYARSLATNPSLSGKVVVELVPDASGNPRARIASSTLNDPALESCLVSVFMRRTWPCMDAEVKIPISFAPAVP